MKKIIYFEFLISIFILNSIFAIETDNIKNIIYNQILNNFSKQKKYIKNIIININENEILNFVKITDYKISSFIDNNISLILYGNDINNNNLEKEIKAKVKILCDVIVANKRILKGDIIMDENISLREYDLLQLKDEPIFIKEQIIGKNVNKNISTYSPILISDIDENIINIGDIINIMYFNDKFTITDKGRAEESGKLNQVIKVRNLKSKKLITGRIISKNSIRIED